MAKGEPRGLYIPDGLDTESKEEIAAWVYRELMKISLTFEVALMRYVEFRNVAPAKPREGMVSGADGTNWDPGSGKGVYAYYLTSGGGSIAPADIISYASQDDLFSTQSGYTAQVINTFTPAASIPEAGIHGTTLPGGETLRLGKVVDPTDASRKALQFQVASSDPTTSGGKRSELSMTANIQWNNTYWVALSVYVYDWGTLATADEALFGMQIHSGDDGGGWSPSCAIYTRGTGRDLAIRARYANTDPPDSGNTTSVWFDDYAIPFGQWTDFIFKFKHNSTVGGGLLQVWMNNTQIVNYTGKFGFNVGENDYMKFGYYNWGTMASNARKVLLRDPTVIHDPTGSTYTKSMVETVLGAETTGGAWHFLG